MGVFGDSQQGQFNPDNPLGIKAPEEMANSGEPFNDGATGIEKNVGEEQITEGQTVIEEPGREIPESVGVEDDYEKKANYVKHKFKSPEDFEKSVVELQKKLGRENEDIELNSAEDAINYYISLEKELGKTSNIDQTRRENQRLQQELQGLRNTVNQFMLQQQYNQPLRDPATGKFVSANEQVTQAQPQDVDFSFDDIDTKEFMKEFYEKGPNAESFKKILKTAAEKIADAKINQALEQQKQEELKKQQEILQKQNQVRVLKTHYDMQVNNIKSQYGEEEFTRNQQSMLNIFKKYPMYLNPQLFPNGFEIVFNEARNMNNSYQAQQQNTQSQQQYNAAQKMAARISGSRPGQRFNRQPGPEDIEKSMLFQPTKAKGIWG